jgi:riboflavin kinase/FMN adenylyltransferase
MRVIRVPDDPPGDHPPAVVAAIGNFDGVHRGHRFLIGQVVERAASLGLRSAVVTFEPHPRSVIRPDAPLALLSALDDRLELLESLGVDLTLVWRFDTAVQRTSAEAFLEQLGRYVRLRLLVHGPGFALGQRRLGTPDVLAGIGQRAGFRLEQVAPLHDRAGAVGAVSGVTRGQSDGADEGDRDVISSSAIRALVSDGRIRRAARALDRPPAVTGVVVQGERIGRTLGFPTANLRLEGSPAVPAEGVYAAWAEIAPRQPLARRYPAAVSIGTRPQFDGTRRVVEAYLIDFAGDLYGQRIRLHFVARLRGQERFPTVDALVAQMRRDVDTARRVLLPAPAESDESETYVQAADG